MSRHALVLAAAALAIPSVPVDAEEQPPAELCNGLDDDGDGEADEEDEDPLCPEGEGCIEGECAGPCLDEDGLPCPPSCFCIDGTCLCEPCRDVECPECERCDRSTGSCVDPCDWIECGAGCSCMCGRCLGSCDDAFCPEGMTVDDGRCVAEDSGADGQADVGPDPDAGPSTDAGARLTARGGCQAAPGSASPTGITQIALALFGRK